MAKRGVNKVIIVGNLGQDPEVKFMPSGEAVANLSVATSETWKDKQTGEQKEKSEWHRIAIFGKLALIAGEYLKKAQRFISKVSYRLENGKTSKVPTSTLLKSLLMDLMVLCKC